MTFDNQCTHRRIFSGHEDYQILPDSLRNIVAETFCRCHGKREAARHKIGLAPTAMAAFSERLATIRL